MAKIKMNTQKGEMSVQQAFDGFIRKCQIKNLSEHTIFYHYESFKYLCKVLNPNESVESLCPQAIQALILDLKLTMKDISINTRLRGIRTFAYHCIYMGYIEPFKIQLLKSDTSIKGTYSDAELKVLLAKPNIKKCQFTELRTWTAINIFVGTGCRIGSLKSVKIKDVLFDECLIRFTKTKGRKQLLVPITKTLNEVLQLYLHYREGSPDDYLICSQNGDKIERDGLIHAVAKYNRSRGVTKTSCHMFRHTFAKHWIINNGDIFRLQKILGHEDIKVTQQYLRDFGVYDLQESFDKYNPLETLSNSSTKIKMA